MCTLVYFETDTQFLVQPHFVYCAVQTNAACLFKKLGWKSLASQHRIAKAVMTYKSLNFLTPNYLSEMFVDHSRVTNYTLGDTSGKL